MVRAERRRTSRLEDDPAGDTAGRLCGEGRPGLGKGVHGTDLGAELAAVDEASDLDELGAVGVPDEVDRADVVALSRRG